MSAKTLLPAIALGLAALFAAAPAQALLIDKCENDAYIIYLAATTKFRFPEKTRTDTIAEIKELVIGLVPDAKPGQWTAADQAKVEKLVEYAFQHTSEAPEVLAQNYAKNCAGH